LTAVMFLSAVSVGAADQVQFKQPASNKTAPVAPPSKEKQPPPKVRVQALFPDPAAGLIFVKRSNTPGKLLIRGVVKNIGTKVSKDGSAQLILIDVGHGPPVRICHKGYRNLQPGMEFALECEIFESSLILNMSKVPYGRNPLADIRPIDQSTPTPEAPAPTLYGSVSLELTGAPNLGQIDDAVLTNNKITKEGREIEPTLILNGLF
jgi:hypothetical protein